MGSSYQFKRAFLCLIAGICLGCLMGCGSETPVGTETSPTTESQATATEDTSESTNPNDNSDDCITETETDPVVETVSNGNSFIRLTVDENIAGPAFVSVSDINADGRTDLVVSAFVEDLDNDGNAEVLVTGYEQQCVLHLSTHSPLSASRAFCPAWDITRDPMLL